MHFRTTQSNETDLRVLAGQLESVLRSLHEQQTRQNIEKEFLDPRRHYVNSSWTHGAIMCVDGDRKWMFNTKTVTIIEPIFHFPPKFPKMGIFNPHICHVQHEDGHDYRARDEYHREEQIFADERRCQRRGRVNLGDQQQKDVERVEDRDAHRDLLAGVGRNVEDEESDGTDSDARQDEVDRVEERLSSDGDVELDVGVRLGAARIVFVVLLRFDRQQIPLRAFVIVVQIDACNSDGNETKLLSLSPRPKLQYQHFQDQDETCKTNNKIKTKTISSSLARG